MFYVYILYSDKHDKFYVGHTLLPSRMYFSNIVFDSKEKKGAITHTLRSQYIRILSFKETY